MRLRRVAEIDLPNASEQPGAGQRAVLRQLQNQQKVRDASDAPDSPAYIRDRTPLKRGQMSTGDLRAEFRKDPALPILLSDDAFRKAVRKGLEDGVYLYKRNELLAGPGDPIRARIAINNAKKSGIRVEEPYGYDRAFGTPLLPASA
jgi:hypothetical protein